MSAVVIPSVALRRGPGGLRNRPKDKKWSFLALKFCTHPSLGGVFFKDNWMWKGKKKVQMAGKSLAQRGRGLKEGLCLPSPFKTSLEFIWPACAVIILTAIRPVLYCWNWYAKLLAEKLRTREEERDWMESSIKGIDLQPLLINVFLVTFPYFLPPALGKVSVSIEMTFLTPLRRSSLRLRWNNWLRAARYSELIDIMTADRDTRRVECTVTGSILRRDDTWDDVSKIFNMNISQPSQAPNHVPQVLHQAWW